jgi:ketosteroid isomerase-like protein
MRETEGCGGFEMRRMIAAAILVGLLGTGMIVTARTESSDHKVKSAVEQVLNRQVEAWNRHDLEGFMAGYWNSPELTFFSGAKVTMGWQSTLERYRKTYQSEGREMGKLDFAELNIQPLGREAAFVRGAWHLTLSDRKTPDGKTAGEKEPHGRFTLIFRKFPEGWRIVHDHTSAAE